MYIPRAKKASRKYRGTRTCGWGRVGQHRKSGGRGGRGHAGMHKHKWSWVLKYAREYFGKHGFKRPPEVVWKLPFINVGELEQLVAELESQGKLEFMDGLPLLEGPKLGFFKVLGRGRVTRPMAVKAPFFTERAVEKIVEAGGRVTKVEAKAIAE
ncbi:MAG: 50S ribosomal protein L15 [Candidatus Nezhaarchaeota archaeon]|nr:50S ribosomal protein L15 [Candidatus Nezhaarchaeota archaeon]